MNVLQHPLVDHWLADLREASTPPAEFRRLVRRLTSALFLQASTGLETASATVRTPLTEMAGRRLASPPLLAPVLRAGLGMSDAILELVPEARVCHVGLYRDHATLEPVAYYLPAVEKAAGSTAFVLDPMLATGGSAVAALDVAKRWGVDRCLLLSLIGAPEGVDRVVTNHPEVEIHLCALDERLNELGYIVPGLGDAGDRQFG